jgi:hypothetical protein
LFVARESDKDHLGLCLTTERQFGGLSKGQNLSGFVFAAVRDTIVLVASPDSQERQANVHPVASLADLNGYCTRLEDMVGQDSRSIEH